MPNQDSPPQVLPLDVSTNRPMGLKSFRRANRDGDAAATTRNIQVTAERAMANRRLPRGGEAVSSTPCRGRAAIHESAPTSEQGVDQCHDVEEISRSTFARQCRR
jgi:hypothetical protein